MIDKNGISKLGIVIIIAILFLIIFVLMQKINDNKASKASNTLKEENRVIYYERVDEQNFPEFNSNKTSSPSENNQNEIELKIKDPSEMNTIKAKNGISK